MSTSAEGSVKGKYDGRKRSPRGFSKNCSAKPGEDALEVREIDVLVEHEALDLVEHWRVRHVGIASIDRPGRDQTDRHALQLHGADLHRRGVGPEQAPVAEVEGVVHRPRRMVGGDVERLEIVEIVLDLGSLGHAEPGPPEDGLDAQACPRHRMQAADRLAAARERHVDSAARKLALERG